MHWNGFSFRIKLKVERKKSASHIKMCLRFVMCRIRSLARQFLRLETVKRILKNELLVLGIVLQFDHFQCASWYACNEQSTQSNPMHMWTIHMPVWHEYGCLCDTRCLWITISFLVPFLLPGKKSLKMMCNKFDFLRKDVKCQFELFEQTGFLNENICDE